MYLEMPLGAIRLKRRGNECFFGRSYNRIEIPGVGHFVLRERPEVVAELVRKLSARRLRWVRALRLGRL
jgi:hypothetical protein